MHDISPSPMKDLATPRWFAVAGQAATVARVGPALGFGVDNLADRRRYVYHPYRRARSIPRASGAGEERTPP